MFQAIKPKVANKFSFYSFVSGLCFSRLGLTLYIAMKNLNHKIEVME